MTPLNFWGLGGMVDVAILISICIAIFLHHRGHYLISVVLSVILISTSLLFISIEKPSSTTTAFSALNIVGFSISVLLEIKLKYILHAYVYIGIFIVFLFQMQTHTFYGYFSTEHLLISFSTYFMVYLIITYSPSALKVKYDSINIELNKKIFNCWSKL